MPKFTYLPYSVLAISLCSLSLNTLSANLNIEIKDQRNINVEDAVIYLTPSDGRTLKSKPKKDIIDQVDIQFLPKIKVITRNSEISFPNKDNIHHHVYSFSDAKKFELPLYKGKPSHSVLFDKTGVVKLGCNIHDWMKGYVLVVDTPYYAQTNKQGTAKINQVSSGEYLVNVWHPDASDTLSFPLRVTKQEKNLKINKQLEINKKLERKPRPRPKYRDY